MKDNGGLKFGEFTFPSIVVSYMESLQDRSASVRCKECADRVHKEFGSLSPFLRGAKISTLLDIGCGVAAINIPIVKKFNVTRVNLLDGDGTLPRQVGYKDDTLAWADVGVGAAMVQANCPAVEVKTHHTLATFLDKLDLVISLRSWGHHYPISVYLYEVKRALRAGGGLIVDIRKGTDGLEELQDAGFTLIGKIPDPSNKCYRLAFTR